MVRCLTEEQKTKKMVRINLNVIFESETSQFLSEKVIAREGVTLVKLTSDNSFVAKNWPIMVGKVYCG